MHKPKSTTFTGQLFDPDLVANTPILTEHRHTRSKFMHSGSKTLRLYCFPGLYMPHDTSHLSAPALSCQSEDGLESSWSFLSGTVVGMCFCVQTPASFSHPEGTSSP